MVTFKRNVFFHVNKFQERILFYLAALGAACLSLMVLFLSYLYADINNFIHTPQFSTIKICIIVALPITALLILIVCFYTYYMTNKMFDPYDRIVANLEDIENTGQKRMLSVRKGDEMFQELIDRINGLIQRLP